MNLNDNPFVSSPEVVQARRRYRCVCGQAVFFRNSQCLNCGRALGYENGRLELVPLEPARASDPTLLRVAGDVDEALYVRCANFETPAGCNWILPLHERDAGQTLCRACRLNRTIPDLSVREHAQGWRLIEIAKRRLVSQLLALRLPVASKLVEDPQRGLAFDILAAPPGGRVMTGHADGLITLDVAEADDAYRERERRALGEPYRTLLGHFRHEAGHYYWDRLVEGSRWLGDFRALFGDERADYSAALRSNYERAPPADWPARFVSRYASVHPWEDWAETWAH
ncbi:MAG TPA: putative zinc-binding metallopeptidase, partial [Burkholderiaceae bacterium]|nr:putative zinc-binding metallopeptidase [Burkholderiaceae bacterium]